MQSYLIINVLCFLVLFCFLFLFFKLWNNQIVWEWGRTIEVILKLFCTQLVASSYWIDLELPNSTYDPHTGNSVAGEGHCGLEAETNEFCAGRHWKVLHNHENSHSNVGCEWHGAWHMAYILIILISRNSKLKSNSLQENGHCGWVFEVSVHRTPCGSYLDAIGLIVKGCQVLICTNGLCRPEDSLHSVLLSPSVPPSLPQCTTSCKQMTAPTVLLLCAKKKCM